MLHFVVAHSQGVHTSQRDTNCRLRRRCKKIKFTISIGARKRKTLPRQGAQHSRVEHDQQLGAKMKMVSSIFFRGP